MRILANRKIKALFMRTGLLISGFSVLSISAVSLQWKHSLLCVMISAICMGILILAVLYFYFKEQDQIMEQAVTQIREYISGNPNARIDCEDEGELYRLFHEVNSLAAILNAYAKDEGKAKRFLKDTISNISHQLKTPLAALNIYNGLVQEESKDIPVIREFADLSEQELDRIETLVQNLLKIAKLDSGTMVLEKTLENLSEIIDGIERHFAYQAKREEKNLILCGDDTVMLLCDRVWLYEAVSNLVKNAFDHTKKGNVICIEWKQFASVVQIIVRDNGRGIQKEDLFHIFKPFYRSRFAGNTPGMGLGLPLAKAIVEAHNGTIEVVSEPGCGTTFTVSFLIPTKM